MITGKRKKTCTLIRSKLLFLLIFPMADSRLNISDPFTSLPRLWLTGQQARTQGEELWDRFPLSPKKNSVFFDFFSISAVNLNLIIIIILNLI